MAEMHRLSICNDLEALTREIHALQGGRVDASVLERIKDAKDKIHAAKESFKKAMIEKYEKWKAAQEAKGHLPHKVVPAPGPSPNPSVPTAVVAQHAAHMVIEFPQAYAERMDTYINGLNTLLELILKVILVKNSAATAPERPPGPMDEPDPDSDTPNPDREQRGASEGSCYYVVQR